MLESPTSAKLEMAHVLFMDIVGYSKLPIDHQQTVLQTLQKITCASPEFIQARESQQLINLPTGDGMALVFFGDPEAPARCAFELSRALKSHPEISLRMGIHSGPVYRVADINTNQNVAGGGINIAQRVMDCGDAGHILASRAIAEMLEQVSNWAPAIHDLGEAEVKHGVRVRIYNLFTEDAGNPEIPQKIRAAKQAAEAVRSKARRNKISMALAAACLAAALVTTGWLLNRHNGGALSEIDTIVLADYANSTGDSVFDDTLKQALSVQLSQSPFLKILSQDRVASTLRLMGRSSSDRLTNDVAREVCVRSGSAAVLAGSIASIGSHYVLGLHALSCRTGDTLAQEQVEVSNKELVLSALGKTATEIRRKLGESHSSIQKFDTPLQQATTPSLEALRAYSMGVRMGTEKGDAESIPFFQKAIELDPNFAVAYAAIGLSFVNLGEDGLAMENFQKAYELKNRVSEREKFRITTMYDGYVTGNLQDSIRAEELWIQAYPRDLTPIGNLGVDYFTLGQYDKGIELALEVLRQNPGETTSYVNLVGLYGALGRLNDAKTAYQQAVDRNLDTPFLHANRYSIAFLEGDAAEMQRQVAWAVGKPGAEDYLLSMQSDTEASFGRFSKARELTRRAVASALRAQLKETAALWQIDAALREAEVGYSRLARRDLAAALAIASSRDLKIIAALVLARSGDSSQAEVAAEDLAAKFPLNTTLNSFWLPTIRATITLHRGDPGKAIELLEPAAPNELASPPPNGAGYLYPAYVRGEAYLALRRGDLAASEFRKFQDHRGVVGNSVLGALARLGMTRACWLQKDTPKALAAYEDFFTLWKESDPDIPILRAAKAEFAARH
jgi:eukaryotic-like serine/threonine-protein kinase